ncbi:MAG TPA: fumarylacetoacetate hydrolase family protein, partial [Acidimicrobiales bacterium]|jgi:2-keto-4-pentenoate hydratase/2-oxohepta-3-ene-1,7-dioic acid hydratase in catechol pathway|nr:fumarylacetoacetate hydrolase family protein [Acidimicrobiales bacterium]
MRLVRVGSAGDERPAVFGDGDEMWYLPESLGDVSGEFFGHGGVEKVRELLESNALVERVGEGVRVGAPIARPEKVICIGLNYRDHANETGSPIPAEPIVFMKAPNCVIGPNDEILVPRGSTKTDWEVELGVVLGRRARYLGSPDDAWSVIAGYSVSHDVSEREFQLERGGQWDKGKCCETFNPLGPWFVSADDVADPQKLSMRLSVNGVLRQNGNTSDMIFGVAYLVWYLSQFMVLEPGDLINTGTPAGVSLGHDDVAYLKAGDTVEVSIEGLGHQRSTLGQA